MSKPLVIDPNDAHAQQDQFEFAQWCALIRANHYAHNVTRIRYLEIGSCLGASLTLAAQYLNLECAVAVDLGYYLDENKKQVFTEDTLRARMKMIPGSRVIIGDSHDEQIVNHARSLGPYDAVFIDGDHLQAGVRLDWINYGPMGKVVGFHDIAYRKFDCGVPRVWASLAATHPHVAIINPKGKKMLGIGAVFL